MSSQDKARAMAENVAGWIKTSGHHLFATPNLRGSLVIEFDTTTGTIRPILRSEAVIPAASPPGTN